MPNSESEALNEIESAVLPVYKERRISELDSSKTACSSYKIKNSYCGILRLSPNSSSTLIENNNFASADGSTTYINYRDNIKDLIDKQFIRVSSSDGVMLDMRITNNAIEYNNLYVNGAVKTSSGIVCYMNEDDTFRLGNLIFPTTYNSKPTSTPAPDKVYVPLTRENLQDGYILVNMAEDGQPADFQFVNGIELIRSFVTDSMNELRSLPTGSIHWMPVSIKQYEELLNRKDAANNKVNSHNGNNLFADTIIRDFLLCDGSLYNIKDFPELAKILKGEQTHYWYKDGNYMVGAHDNCLKTISDEEVRPAGTFRVPDMRSMFMQYLIPTLDKVNAEGNRTGDYEIDSNKTPNFAVDRDSDLHYHYIVLDGPFNTSTNEHTKLASESKISFGHTIEGSDMGLPTFNRENPSTPLVRYGSGKTGAWGVISGAGGGGCHQKPCFGATGTGGPSYIYYPYISNRNCTVGGHTCGYFLSSSKLYTGAKNESIPLSNYHGISSFNIPMHASITSSSANAINYTKNKDVYNVTKLNQYISSDKGLTGLSKMYGKENTPEYFACLPLIKI